MSSSLDRLRPDQVAAAVAGRSVAYVPIGSLEHHGPHLPLGVDMATSAAVCERACAITGGVVLPGSFIASSTLDLPWSLRFSSALVQAWAEEVVDQLHRSGFRLVVLVTGHGPLDLVHLLKRVARSRQRSGAAVLAGCYFEWNAARLTAPQHGEPTVIDHASTVETSWMLACQPDSVDLASLPTDPAAPVRGVYGANPRHTASAQWGAAEIAACAAVLAERVDGALAGPQDDLADLRTFVRLCWTEPLVLTPVSGVDPGTFALEHSGRASRYLSKVVSVSVDGVPLDLHQAYLLNTADGEVGEPVRAVGLGAEHGFYLRREQTATLTVPPPGVPPPARAQLTVDLELGGVARQILVCDWHAT